VELGSLLEEDPPYGHTPESHQLSTFETEWKRTGEGAKACDATPADFMIDIEGLPKSPWNVSAGRVFTDHLIQKMGLNDTQEMRKKVEKAFTSRIKSLKSSCKRKRLSEAERASERSRHARQQRKYQVLYIFCSNLCASRSPKRSLQYSYFTAAVALLRTLLL
jgi:hypothetical protein